MRCPGLCGEMSHLHFLVFGAQEAGACHGQVHPEHAEEQQAADGPQGGHGSAGWGQMGLEERGVSRQHALPSPCLRMHLSRSPADSMRGSTLGL